MRAWWRRLRCKHDWRVTWTGNAGAETHECAHACGAVHHYDEIPEVR